MSEKHDQITDRLGSILRELREEKGLTREWVAEHSDTGLRHLAAIELGDKNPSVDTLYRLIRGIGVSSDRVFYPELSETESNLDDIIHLSATCTPKQRKLIADFIEVLLKQEYID